MFDITSLPLEAEALDVLQQEKVKVGKVDS